MFFVGVFSLDYLDTAVVVKPGSIK